MGGWRAVERNFDVVNCGVLEQCVRLRSSSALFYVPSTNRFHARKFYGRPLRPVKHDVVHVNSAWLHYRFYHRKVWCRCGSEATRIPPLSSMIETTVFHFSHSSGHLITQKAANCVFEPMF